MTITSSTVLRRVEDVRFRAVDDETVVIRQEAAEALVLNEVAGRLLEMIDGQHTVAALIQRLVDEYDVPVDELTADVQEYLEELLAGGLVTPA